MRCVAGLSNGSQMSVGVGWAIFYAGIRVNLRHVPAKLRPRQEPLDPDEKTLASS